SVHVSDTQALLTQTPPPSQSAAPVHATQWPAPSQTLPPLAAQGVPAPATGFVGVPALHLSSVHASPSTGTSRSSATSLTPPFPSQISRTQSPPTWCEVGVPSATFAVPQ